MKAGDPKQTVVLSVVAVVVLGVAVMRILPKKSSSLAEVAKAQKEAAAAQASVSADETLVLRTDPFFHPELGIDRTKVATPPDPSDTTPAQPLPGINTDVVPWRAPAGTNPVQPVGPNTTGTGDQSAGSGSAGGTGKDPSANGKPEETTGVNQQEESSPQVVVNAILTVAKPLAYIAIDGVEVRLGIGGDLNGLGTIVSISSRAVVVKTAKGKVTLIVGEPKKL